jgi:hypothetical protein
VEWWLQQEGKMLEAKMVIVASGTPLLASALLIGLQVWVVCAIIIGTSGTRHGSLAHIC